MEAKEVYISFGSNLGEREKNIKRALELIEMDPNIIIEEISSIYETEPFGKKDQEWFLNGVVKVRTFHPPQVLLGVLQDIEKRIGRRREKKWGPRKIDLDLLLFDNECIDTKLLKIPHPYLHKRRFVLVPLAEIAQDLFHPRLKKRIEELLLETKDTCEVRRWRK